jgi:hypothetical protein
MFKRFRIVFMCIAAMIASPCTPAAWADDVLRMPQSVPRDMVRLLHKDTTAFVYINSATEIVESIKVLADSIDESKSVQPMLSEMNAKTLLGSLVLTKNEIMIDQPIGIGLLYPGTSPGDSATIVVIFRVESASPKTVMAKGKGRRLMFLEGTDWIAVTNAEASWAPLAENAPTPSIVQHMLPGQCAMSFDQAGLVATESHKKINASIKEQIKSSSIHPGMQQPALELFEDFIYGFTRWDFAFDIADGDLTFDARYEPTADSRFKISAAPGLVDLGHRLPGQLGFQSVFNTACVSSGLDVITPFVIAQAGKDKQMAAKLLSDMSGLLASQGDGGGLAAGFSEYGLDLAQIVQVKDAAATFALIDAYIDDINAAKAGVHYKRMPVLVGGDSSRLYEVTFDKKDMKEANPILSALVDSEFMEMVDAVGEDKIYLRIISKGDLMAVVAGEPKLLGRMRRALSQPSAFNPSLDHIAATTEGEMVMAMSLDIRSLVNGLISYVHSHPKVADEKISSPIARSVMAQLKPIAGPPAAFTMSMAVEADGAVMSRSVFEVEAMAQWYKQISTEFWSDLDRDEAAKSKSKPAEKSDK